MELYPKRWPDQCSERQEKSKLSKLYFGTVDRFRDAELKPPTGIKSKAREFIPIQNTLSIDLYKLHALQQSAMKLIKYSYPGVACSPVRPDIWRHANQEAGFREQRLVAGPN